MRVLVWNCSLSLRKKIDLVMRLSPDIAIIGNSEFPDRLYPKESRVKISNSLWFGNERNCGLGVYSFGKWHVQPHEMYTSSEKTVVPIECSYADFSIMLIAIQGTHSKGKSGYGHPLVAYETARSCISAIGRRTAILAGEFGEAAAATWHDSSETGGFDDIQRILANHDLRSCYHSFTREAPGREKTPTLFEGRDLSRPAHTTYCFASTDLLMGLQDVQAGAAETWIDYGEHMPLVVDFA